MLPAIKRPDRNVKNLAEIRDRKTENQLAMIEIAGTHSDQSVFFLHDLVANLNCISLKIVEKG